MQKKTTKKGLKLELIGWDEMWLNIKILNKSKRKPKRLAEGKIDGSKDGRMNSSSGNLKHKNKTYRNKVFINKILEIIGKFFEYVKWNRCLLFAPIRHLKKKPNKLFLVRDRLGEEISHPHPVL